MPAHPSAEPTGRSAELERQSAKDEEYRKHCKAHGIEPHIEKQGAAIEYQNDYASASYTPDMAETIDSITDLLIEKHGNPELVRAIVAGLEEPMKRESDRTQANVVARVVCYIVKCDKGDLQARVFGLMHAFPRLAAAEGFGSMAQSGEQCGKSREWIRKMRDYWCDALAIPVPQESAKSEEAKEKYRQNALTNHPSRRKFKAA